MLSRTRMITTEGVSTDCQAIELSRRINFAIYVCNFVCNSHEAVHTYRETTSRLIDLGVS